MSMEKAKSHRWASQGSRGKVLVDNGTYMPQHYWHLEVGLLPHWINNVPKHLQHEILDPSTKSQSMRYYKKLKIAGSRDRILKPYHDWHCKQVDDVGWKEFQAIAKPTFQARLPLERLFDAQESSKFSSHIKFYGALWTNAKN